MKSKEFWLNDCKSRPYKSEIIFENFSKYLDIPNSGYCLQLGVGQGHTLNLMKDFFGTDRTRGIDLYNFSNDPCVIAQDISLIDFNLPIAFAENDIGNMNIDPAPRLQGYIWCLKNLVKGGKLITTSNVANSAFGVDVEELAEDYNCTTTRLDNFNNEEWARFINNKSEWNTVSLMLVTKL